MPAKRVLIVDDQKDIRQLLRDSIQLLGGDIDIIDVPSGEEAMLVISRQRFDLLVSDVRLAGISGLELVRKIKKRNPGLKVILVTGMTDLEIRQQVSQAGAEAFFFKPVNMDSFQAAVTNCLELKDTRRERLQPDESVAGLSQTGMTSSLERLREKLEADCVFWLDASGELLERSGECPPELDYKELVQSVLRVEQAREALEALLGIESLPEYSLFQGRFYWLHLTSSAGGRMLLALTRSERVDSERDTARKILIETAAVLQGKPAETAPVQPDNGYVPPVEYEENPLAEAGLSELDSVLRASEGEKANMRELDEFWDAAAEQAISANMGDSGSISYEQALRLGIAPKEDSQ